jgi:hypothetical protein
MVEFEDNGVVLPTIDAALTAEPFEDIFACLLPSGGLCGLDLTEMQRSAFAEVGLEAVAAPPLVAVLVAVEGSERQRLLAPLASPL